MQKTEPNLKPTLSCGPKIGSGNWITRVYSSPTPRKAFGFPCFGSNIESATCIAFGAASFLEPSFRAKLKDPLSWAS